MGFRSCIVFIVLFSVSTAHADSYDEAFDAMSNDLANPAKSFSFVKTAVRQGDLAGAVAALERILRINPTLANIQLELGVLYLRLGAPEIASDFLTSALKSPDVPVTVRNRAKNLLARASQSTRRHNASFSLRTTTHYDDNANASPVDPEVRVGGGIGFLDEDATGRHDVSWDVSTALQYTYALNSEAGNQLEASLGSYHRRYEDSGELDVNSVTLQFGPRFNFGPVFSPSVSLRPYVLASRLEIAGDKYLEGIGGGLNLRRVFSTALQGDLTVEYRDQDYFDTTRRRFASERSGDQITLRGQLAYFIDPKKYIALAMSAGQRDAEVDYEQRDEYGVRLTYSQAFLPFEGRRPWRLTFSVSADKLDYDAGDPQIDRTIARDDERLGASVVATIPLASRFSLLLSTSYTDVSSSLPNFEYDNWGGSLGLRIAF